VSSGADWPDDADGGVLRRLAAQDFDFSKTHQIEFNIDFKFWPPPTEAVERIRERFPNVSSIKPEEDFDGYLLVCVSHTVTYKFVIETQRDLSNLMAPFGGICESWGLFHEGRKDP
jgi:hypothetical protein